MTAPIKRPAFQFYPADWRKDMALQSCSVAARGLWIDCMCIAHECEPYGHLTVNGNGMTAAQIGRHTGLSARECQALLDELEQAGVFERTEEGVIFSRRMVRDEDLRNRRAAGGGAGAEHGHKGAEAGSKGGRPKTTRGVSEPPNKPPPSSSSSSSSSKDKPARKRATPLPDGFGISERVRNWAASKGLNHLEEQLEALVSYAKRKGATYVDWDEALMTAIRDDWAKVNKPGERTADIFAGAV